MKRAPPWLGLADDRNGCLFQSFGGGTVLLAVAARWTPTSVQPYLAIGSLLCMSGWIVIFWIETRK